MLGRTLNTYISQKQIEKLTPKEYNNCVKDYSDNLFRFVLKNLAKRADAEDIVQNTFEKLWRNRASVKIEKAKSFLFTVAYNDMIDWIRKNKFLKSVQQLPDNGHRGFQQQLESKELLDRALEELNTTQRSLIMLRDYEGYRYDEIAVITELTESQVKVYLFRAKKKLRIVLQGLGYRSKAK